MNVEFESFADAIAEIEMLVKEGFNNFKVYKDAGCLWRVVAK